ncbi:hypothetical protein Metvu_0331 [Methanocaldococcus vulcanius M7]|uniref:Uncharacterized protein n=1 Tax=Methanocaldococcus vulcanius (strain ATCC 700851 / DSM 12094 / M7) TaxID=579137 RepID=C9RF46_METVM|nr:hypothetical protein [Methanocaldococcus vulcanius]ACX72198.1 hypothetical protein Metvu_0331 [Methanocaldococcus vulcanius M7]
MSKLTYNKILHSIKAKRINSNTKIMLIILLCYIVILVLLLALNQPYMLWLISKYLLLTVISLILYFNIIKNVK